MLNLDTHILLGALEGSVSKKENTILRKSQWSISQIVLFRSDPANELIAATSVVHRIPLLTRDKRILRSKIVSFAA